MDDEIDLRDIFRVLWKRRLMIIGIFIVAVTIAGVISFAMTPVYRVSSIIALGNFDEPSYTSLASAKSIMLNDQFLIEVFQQLPNNKTSDFRNFKNSIKIKPVKDSDRLVEISIETSDRQEGREAIEKLIFLYANRSKNSYIRYEKILSNQLDTTQERLNILDVEINQTLGILQNMQNPSSSSALQAEIGIYRVLDRLSSMETQRSALVDKRLDLQRQIMLSRHLEVISPAGYPLSPIWPRRVLIIGIGGMLGLMVGILAAFLREELGRPAE